MTRRRSTLYTIGALALAVAWMFTLRPQSLGGPAGYVMVRGVSMLPTFEGGDLVIVRPQGSYRPGDVVAYRVPDGDAGEGIMVIHRIVSGTGAGGFTLRGDNNDIDDDWHPKQNDVVGKAWFRLPHTGAVLAFLHSPLPLASIATGIAVAVVMVPSPSKGRTSTGRQSRPRSPRSENRRPQPSGSSPDRPNEPALHR